MTMTNIIIDAILFLFICIELGIIVWLVRKIRNGRLQMIKKINEIQIYRDALINSNVMRQIVPEVTPPAPDDVNDDRDRNIFLRFDRKIMNERLFLNADLSRDDLAQLMGVNKNRFASIMQRYSGQTNSAVYLNTKRVEYAVSLMRQHPNYTIQAIARECGMKNTVTFNRIFKEIYNMTPSEFRQGAK